ncbi:hypothetical protein QP092_05490, partial [Klebsiella pneumoniae]|uniref:hypothetical protein n=1 Tax=Klebsiella pneumoniae TaxID=573 RepID=UPI00254C6C29
KRAYCLKTQPATGETYPKSDLFNKANHHQKLLLICKKLFQNFMLSLDGSFACKGVMSRRGECYARHAACGNEKVLIANGEGKRQSKAFLQLR